MTSCVVSQPCYTENMTATRTNGTKIQMADGTWRVAARTSCGPVGAHVKDEAAADAALAAWSLPTTLERNAAWLALRATGAVL